MTSPAGKTAKNTAWASLQSGTGRPIGPRNASTIMMEQLLDGEAEATVRKTVEKARKVTPLHFDCGLERIVPPRRDRPISFALPTITTAADAMKATGALIAAVVSEVTPSEAARASVPRGANRAKSADDRPLPADHCTH